MQHICFSMQCLLQMVFPLLCLFEWDSIFMYELTGPTLSNHVTLRRNMNKFYVRCQSKIVFIVQLFYLQVGSVVQHFSKLEHFHGSIELYKATNFTCTLCISVKFFQGCFFEGKAFEKNKRVN